MKWTLAWEDLLYGGDQNFTDMIAEIGFEAVQQELLVRYSFGFSDVGGRPVQSVCVGEEFFVDVYIHDTRHTPQGVFSAALDLEYSAALAEVNAPIIYGPLFPNYNTGTAGNGLVDELGGAATLAGAGSGSLVARVPMRASTAGRLVVSGNPADLPTHETTLIGMDDSVPDDGIVYETAELLIKPARRWHNSVLPVDVNQDGLVSPVDVLNIINFLNANGSTTNLYSVAADELFSGRAVDVNDDGAVTPLDALLVINWLNANGRRA